MTTTAFSRALAGVASLGCGVILSAQAPAYRVIAEVPLSDAGETRVVAAPDGSFMYGVSGNETSEVGSVDQSGVRRWSIRIPSPLIGLEAARERALALTIEPGVAESGVAVRARILDSTNGSVVRQFRNAGGMVFGISAAGDAIVSYANTFENPSPTITIRKVDSGDTRTLHLDRPVNAVVPLDYNRVVVLLDDGRVDFLDGDRREWTVSGEPVSVGSNLFVAAEVMIALVPLPMGAFQIIDLKRGSEVFRYSPAEAAPDAPDRALTSLKLLDAARAAAAAPNGPRLRQLAANLRADLAHNGDVRFYSVHVDGVEARLQPRTGVVERSHSLEGFKKVMAARGQGAAFEEALGRRGGTQRIAIASSGAGVVATAGKLVLIGPGR